MLSADKKDFITLMEAAGVLRFGSFTLKSGRVSPYFINTGDFRSGRHLAALGRMYAAKLMETVGDDFNALFGPAYKGIPLVAACAAALWEVYQVDKPYFFNRKEAKDHGEGGAMVGYLPVEGDRVVIIEDVISSGASVREVLPLLKAFEGIEVTDMIISVDRMEYGQKPGMTAIMEVREEFGLAVHALVTIDDVREWLLESGKDEALIKSMDAYAEQYCVR